MKPPTELKPENLDIQPSVKLANGSFVNLSYNPYTRTIVQETRNTQGHVEESLSKKLPLDMLINIAGIKKIILDGLLPLEGKLLGIARATVLAKNDHAIFFHLEDPKEPSWTYNVATCGGKIKSIEMAKTAKGDLLASLMVKMKSCPVKKFYLHFTAETTHIKRVYNDK